MNIKTAIFDFDGTLFDSMYIWDTIGEDYLRSLGIEPKENLNEIFKNMSLHQAASYYRNEYGVTLSVEDIMEGVNARIGHFYRDEVMPKRGAAEFLSFLGEKNVKMCIATATDRHLVESALERCGGREYFKEIFTCTSVGHGKDEPLIYREAMKFLDADRRSTIIFEDAFYAVETAKKDGFITAAVFDPYEKNSQEIRELADFYLTDFMDFNTFWKSASEK